MIENLSIKRAGMIGALALLAGCAGTSLPDKECFASTDQANKPNGPVAQYWRADFYEAWCGSRASSNAERERLTLDEPLSPGTDPRT